MTSRSKTGGREKKVAEMKNKGKRSDKLLVEQQHNNNKTVCSPRSRTIILCSKRVNSIWLLGSGETLTPLWGVSRIKVLATKKLDTRDQGFLYVLLLHKLCILGRPPRLLPCGFSGWQAGTHAAVSHKILT